MTQGPEGRFSKPVILTFIPQAKRNQVSIR
jgi:hypothetical protein